MNTSQIIILLLVLSLMMNMACVYMVSNKEKDSSEEDYAMVLSRVGKGGVIPKIESSPYVSPAQLSVWWASLKYSYFISYTKNKLIIPTNFYKNFYYFF